MKRKIILNVASFLVILLAVFCFVQFAQAAIYIPTTGETGLSNKPIKDILSNFLKWLLWIIGIVAIIGFCVSGIQYITASGDEKIMETAKRNMMYSIIGTIVALSAYVIVKAVDAILRGSFII